MKIHGIRPELQPEAIAQKARLAQEANKQADKPVRGHDDIVPSVKESQNTTEVSRLLDKKA